MSHKTKYRVTTKLVLEVEYINVVEATHFMVACNRIDEELPHPVDVLRKQGFMVNTVTTNHKITKE